MPRCTCVMRVYTTVCERSASDPPNPDTSLRPLLFVKPPSSPHDSHADIMLFVLDIAHCNTMFFELFDIGFSRFPVHIERARIINLGQFVDDLLDVCAAESHVILL